IANLAEPSPLRGIRTPANPNCSFTVLKESENIVTCKFRILHEVAVLPACQAIPGANPKSSVARSEQAKNVGGREMLVRWLLPRDVPDAIEAKQAELRA